MRKKFGWYFDGSAVSICMLCGLSTNGLDANQAVRRAFSHAKVVEVWDFAKFVFRSTAVHITANVAPTFKPPLYRDVRASCFLSFATHRSLSHPCFLWGTWRNVKNGSRECTEGRRLVSTSSLDPAHAIIAADFLSVHSGPVKSTPALYRHIPTPQATRRLSR